MAEITGVDPQTVKPTFDTLRQALPSVETIEGFLSAHQMSVTELSIMYCDALVDNNALRTSFFGTVDFNNMDVPGVIDVIYDKMVGLPDIVGANDVTSAPTHAEVSQELTDLHGRLCSGSCTAARAQVALKSMCASVLGSAALLIQ